MVLTGFASVPGPSDDLFCFPLLVIRFPFFKKIYLNNKLIKKEGKVDERDFL